MRRPLLVQTPRAWRQGRPCDRHSPPRRAWPAQLTGPQTPVWLSPSRSARTPDVVHLLFKFKFNFSTAFTYTETIKTIRDGETRTATSPFIQLQSSDVSCSTVIVMRSRVALGFSLSKNARCSSPVFNGHSLAFTCGYRLFAQQERQV